VLSRRLLKIGLVLSALISCISDAQTSKAQNIIITVNSPGSLPYLFFNTNTQKYSGLVVDFFQELQQKGLFIPTFIDSNQARSEQFLIEGKADIYLANPTWLSDPSNVLTSIPIIEHATYLYSLMPFEANFSLDKLINKRICTHHSFKYTGLQSYFDTHQLERVDASDQTTMATMLTKQRCDYLVMNNYNAAAIFSESSYCNFTIYQSPQPTSMVNLYFIIRPGLIEVKSMIDKELKLFINEGKVLASIASHSGTPRFPHQASCIYQRHNEIVN
jgi:ABC-type amino acid transport substrate-binding protein